MTFPSPPCLMLVTEPNPDLDAIVAAAVAGGVNAVQLRDKAARRPDLLAVGRALRSVVAPAVLIVNGDVSVSQTMGADGVHLAETAHTAGIGMRVDLRMLLGRSVHTLEAAQEACRDGADYLVAGTIFASQSHPDIAPAGLDFLREVCAEVQIPVLAIGGVTPERVKGCITAGAAGVAVLSPLMRAADPRRVAQEYRAALDAAWEERTCR